MDIWHNAREYHVSQQMCVPSPKISIAIMLCIVKLLYSENFCLVFPGVSPFLYLYLIKHGITFLLFMFGGPWSFTVPVVVSYKAWYNCLLKRASILDFAENPQTIEQKFKDKDTK